MKGGGPVTVLVIDDSAYNRRTLTQLLESFTDVRVVGRAGDGEEGLRKVIELRPDLVTLDLEMPKLDGYAFLRLLMGTLPTPVIVVSSYAHRTDVFKALELGAFDFIAKPSREDPEWLSRLSNELHEKVHAVRLIRPAGRRLLVPKERSAVSPFVAALGASTGGPPAVQRVLEALAAEPSACLLVCQHMPKHFTRAFAERLDRIGPFTVKEARDGDVVAPGHAFIAPGGHQMVLAERGGRLELRTPPSNPQDKYAPCVDRLFTSMAEVLGSRALGVVLTGMGADGAAGALAIHQAGGEVWAESAETAVIFGMPQKAIDTGAVKRVLPLGDMGPALVACARRRRL